MRSPSLVVGLTFIASLVGCSTKVSLEKRLVGKWEAKGSIFGSMRGYTDTRFEFFADGSVAESGKSLKGWEQERTGTFKFADDTHVKIDLGWAYGTTIYEADWRDNDHVTLRVADTETIPLHRVN